MDWLKDLLQRWFGTPLSDDEEPRLDESHEEPHRFDPPPVPDTPPNSITDTSTDVTVCPPFPEDEVEPEIEEPGGMTVGVWAGKSSLNSPERDIQFCVDTGINRIDIIVNDHSGARAERDFDLWPVAMIVKLAAEARGAGMEVHLMSWIMPHAKYIDKAAESLVTLCNDLNVDSLQWDAEEPWTQARSTLAYGDAAKRIASAFSDLKCPMGVNGIGYTPVSKFAPLAEVCDYVVPQCYATSSSKLDPTTCVPKFVRRYRAKFGTDKPVQIGLAAYRQPPPGFTAEGAMAASFAGAEAIEGCDAVIYWSLGSIRRSNKIAKIIRGLTQNR